MHVQRHIPNGACATAAGRCPGNWGRVPSCCHSNAVMLQRMVWARSNLSKQTACLRAWTCSRSGWCQCRDCLCSFALTAMQPVCCEALRRMLTIYRLVSGLAPRLKQSMMARSEQEACVGLLADMKILL